MTFEMEKNGTISKWQTDDEMDIFYPESQVPVGADVFLRGGAPPCCPNFGVATTDGPLEGISLPLHGLLHGSEGVSIPTDSKNADEASLEFSFLKPWPHHTKVTAHFKRAEKAYELRHRISLTAHDAEMPYSLGFHPYFATGGKPFVLKNGDQTWRDTELRPPESFFVPKHKTPFEIAFAHGTMLVQLDEGYTHFCVWTDRPDLYICVEPVTIAEPSIYEMLPAGETRTGACTLTYSPNI